MKEQKAGEFRSSVYTQRPTYADFSAPAKFQAIQGIIAKRLMEHPNAMCSYSGGSDSDILMHLIETVRELFDLPHLLVSPHVHPQNGRGEMLAGFGAADHGAAGGGGAQAGELIDVQ